jgi:hypothetical protein
LLAAVFCRSHPAWMIAPIIRLTFPFSPLPRFNRIEETQ